MGRAFVAFGVLFTVVALIVGCQSMAGSPMASQQTDATITAAVKTRLVAERTANLTRVDIDTNHGVVYLNGSVETARQKTYAARLAHRTDGVKGVVDNLQVARSAGKESPWQPDVTR